MNRKDKVSNLKDRLKMIDEDIEVYTDLRRKVQEKLNHNISMLSIESIGITLKDVQFSAKESKIFVFRFNDMKHFLDSSLDAKYCEFNGELFFVEDAIKGIMKSCGRYEDLK